MRTIVKVLLPLLLLVHPVGAEEPPSVKMLQNAAYMSEWFDSGTVLLKDGSYTGDGAEGGATRTVVRLADTMAFGQINNEPLAAVVLVTDAGGSGLFYDLAVVAMREEKPVNLAVTHLGDRIRIESLAIRQNAIHVTMVSHGPNDPSCCPTQRTVKAYALAGGSRFLEEVPPSPAPAAPAAEAEGLVGPTWQWARYEGSDDSTLVVANPDRYTIAFQPDKMLAITADCNSGSGSYTLSGNSITIPAFALTMAECPPESLSSRFLRDLGQVASFVLKGEKLYLNLRMDAGNLVFTRGEGP